MMLLIPLTTESGQTAVFNMENVAYIAEPPKDAAERGVGAGIALVDNGMDVIPVKETISDILKLASDQLAHVVDAMS